MTDNEMVVSLRTALARISALHQPERFDQQVVCAACMGEWPCRTVGVLSSTPGWSDA